MYLCEVVTTAVALAVDFVVVLLAIERCRVRTRHSLFVISIEISDVFSNCLSRQPGNVM